MIGTLASRITGLLREVLLVSLFSAKVSDAFRIAWTVPNLFRELLAEGALTNAIIPSYQELPEHERRAFSGATFSILFLINAFLLALAIISAPLIVDLLLANQSHVDRELAVMMTRILFPLLMAVSFSAVAMGILNSEEHFFAPAWAPVALNVVMIILMLTFKGNAQWLAVAAVLGGIAQFLIQLPSLAKHKLLPKLGAWWHPKLAIVLMLMAPFAFTTGARQFLNVIAQRIVSNEQLFMAGAVSAYSIAGMLYALALGLFGISPALAYYSRLSSDAIHDKEKVKSTLAEGIRFISFLCVPASLILVVFSEPIVKTLFGLLKPGEGQETTIQLAILAIQPLGLTVFPAGLINFTVRPFYIRKKVRAPIIISVIFTFFTAILFVLLAPGLGIRGLTAATAFSAWLQFMVLLYWVKRDEGLSLKPIVWYMARVWLAASLAVFLAFVLTTYLMALFPEISPWFKYLLELSVAGVIVIVSYLGFAHLMKLPELSQLIKRFRR